MNREDLQHAETYRDRVSTVSAEGKRKWVYALKPSGRFYNYRNLLSAVYLITFFVLPFIKVNGMPFLMLNVTSGKFIIFSKIFWPHDFYIFAFAMITYIIFVALFTVIYGRLFCGWVCPQTVFMEFVFRKIEWLIEGSPQQQQNRDASNGSFDKAWRKVLKHFIFFIISFVIANTFLAYIVGIDALEKIISEPMHDHVALFSGLIVFTILFYSVFAFVRDLVCTTVCPYGRLQGVLLDKDSMQIAYDYKRGEPRGKISRHRASDLGDCVDCKKCIQVCPTGIDIRNGLQMECVGCTACIDACNEMMDKAGFARGLIRYTSENQIVSRGKFVFNTRMKAYTALLGILFIVMSVMVITRQSVDAYVTRARGQLFSEMPGHKIANLYNTKIINKTQYAFPVEYKVENAKADIQLVGETEMKLKPESVNNFTFFVVMDSSLVKERSTKLQLGVYRNGKKIETVKTTFLGPFM